MLRILGGRVNERLGQPAADVLLVSRLARAQHVERDARDDGRQPAAEILDRRGIRPDEPEPGLLHGILGLAHRAEHAVRDRTKVRAVSLELLGQQVRVAHGHILSVAVVISLTDERPHL